MCLGILAGSAIAAETDAEGALFQPSADPLADVQQALDRAGQSDRLALVVLGANWCHDSRALAARLHDSPLEEVVEQHYEMVLVDVGFFETGRALTQEFGVAHYYATPTVLIIDPASRDVINNEDRHIWGNAYSIDIASSVQYFEKWATNESVADPAEDSAELGQLYAEIDQFERQLADRVDDGYAVVGPMLEAYKAGDEPEAFEASWNEVRDFRMAIPGDIEKLRDEARRRVLAGEADIQLAYPEYARFSWETE